MARWVGIALVVITGIVAGGVVAPADGGPPAVGASLPEIILKAPKSAEARAYLGLKGEGEFKLSDIAAEVVVIEIFSMYCPYCQKDAPTLNAMFRKIEADPALKGKVKLIGIGAGNSAFEVDYFKTHYEVPFPLFPDGDFKIHKALGEVRTPYFITVRLAPNAAPRVTYSKLGGAPNADELLSRLLQGSGLK
ncbi:MAG: TlpA family protein disulfide reductase [Desulfobacteraceae bacterium]|nr:MAG: TlpA family protein disulfide reductase [Desulfobacteraceae bacterium]